MEKQALGMSMQISQEFIDNLAREMVSESLMKTLGGSDRFVEELIRQVLMVKVNEDGKPSTYYDAKPYLEYLVNKIIRDEVQETVAEIMNEKRPEIRAALRKELSKKKVMDSIYDKFIACMVDNVQSSWKTKINVEFSKDKDY